VVGEVLEAFPITASSPTRAVVALRFATDAVQSRAALALVLAAFLTISLAYNVVSPPFENPDEINHAEYAAFIGEHARMPDLLTDCVRLAFHPPLYHALIAPIAVAMHVGTEAVMRDHTLNPDYRTSGVILRHDDPQEAFPYAGRARFVHVARAVTMLFAAITLIYTYELVRLLTGDALAALLATATVAAIPQFEYIASSVNHDGVAAALAAGCIYHAVQITSARSRMAGVVTGAMLGLGLLVKSSLVVLAPLPLALWLVASRRRGDGSGWGTITSYLVAFAISGWWYVAMILRWGEPFPIVQINQRTWAGFNLMRTTPFGVGDLAATSKQLFQSFWFLAGLMNIPAHPLEYGCWIGMSAVALLGLLRMSRIGVEAVLALIAVAAIVAVLDYNRYINSAQGRYLFIVLPIFGLAVAHGFIAVTPASMRGRAAALLIACVTAAAGGCLISAFAPVYAQSRAHDRSATPPARSFTAQLYCRNEYSQVVASSGGALRAIRLHGRRVGNSTFTLEARIDAAGDVARWASVSGSAMSADDSPVEFAFDPLIVRPGEVYRVTLSARDATPFGRPALEYTRSTRAEPVHFDGRPLDGSLDLDEVLD
jgi:hypothetical protein